VRTAYGLATGLEQMASRGDTHQARTANNAEAKAHWKRKSVRRLPKEESKKRMELQSSRSPAGPPQEYGAECGGDGGVPYLSVAQRSARLTRITVWHRDYVDGIQLETDLGLLPKIGGSGLHHDVRVDRFELGPDEFLTGITVEYWRYVDRLVFHTSKSKYGPYGGSGGVLKKTLMAPPGRKVVGFKGRHWQLVDSIQLMIL
jgi:hypothetical protein